jgi:hypothetical protein
MSAGEVMANFVLRQINRFRHERDAVYLDTNAWSALAKGQISFEPLKKWVKENGYYLWMTRFSMVELAGDTRLSRPFANLLKEFPVVMLDYGGNELKGSPWYSVEIVEQQILQITDDLVDVIVDEYASGPIRDARAKILEDGRDFGMSIQKEVSELPAEKTRHWSGFAELMSKRIRRKCQHNGIEINEAAIQNLECFIGERLSHSVVYWRYFISRQSWKPSDYIDYLHTMDMAYARTVITENNLTECIRQVARKTKIMTPDVYPYTEFLPDPFAWQARNKTR